MYSYSAADPSGYEFAVARFSGAAEGLHLDPASDSGISDSDNITSTATPTFDTFDPAGYYERIYRNGTLVTSSYASGTSMTLSAQPAGTWNYPPRLLLMRRATSSAASAPGYSYH